MALAGVPPGAAAIAVALTGLAEGASKALANWSQVEPEWLEPVPS
jgi:hypothetical protein